MASPLSDDDLLALWEAYEAGRDSLKMLAARFGLSVYALRRLADENGWTRSSHPATLRPRSWLNKPCPGLGECPERSELIAQSWILAQRQIDEIDLQFLDTDEAPNAKRVNPVTQARALGVVVRVLKDLVALDRAARAESSADETQGGLNSDGLRDELARRLAAIESARTSHPSPGGS